MRLNEVGYLSNDGFLLDRNTGGSSRIDRSLEDVGSELTADLTLPVLVEHDITLLLNEDTFGERTVESTESVAVVEVVVVLEDFLDVFGDLRLVVEGDDGEEVVCDVVVGDVVEEEAADPAKERSVDGADGTAEEGPLVLAVVGHGGVSVVQEGQHDDPVVGQEVGRDEHGGKSKETVVVGPVCDDTCHERKTNVGSDDGIALLGLEQSR